MISEESNKQYLALSDWLQQTEWSVFGTLKFTDGQSIPEDKAEALLRLFFNKLDRLYLGSNLVKSGQRIERVTFKHLGSSGENLHYHFIANPIGDAIRFCEIARQTWGDIGRETLSYDETRIEEIKVSDCAATYGLHEFWRAGADTIHLATTHRANLTLDAAPMAKLRRLLNQDTLNRK